MESIGSGTHLHKGLSLGENSEKKPEKLPPGQGQGEEPQ